MPLFLPPPADRSLRVLTPRSTANLAGENIALRRKFLFNESQMKPFIAEKQSRPLATKFRPHYEAQAKPRGAASLSAQAIFFLLARRKPSDRLNHHRRGGCGYMERQKPRERL